MKLNEISVNVAVDSILNRVKQDSPNNIQTAGKLFDNYNINELFTDEEGNNLPFLKWLFLIYKKFKSKSIDNQTIKEYLFYFLLPVEKKFRIIINI